MGTNLNANCHFKHGLIIKITLTKISTFDDWSGCFLFFIRLCEEAVNRSAAERIAQSQLNCFKSSALGSILTYIPSPERLRWSSARSQK